VSIVRGGSRRGASQGDLAGGWAHQKGRDFSRRHGQKFLSQRDRCSNWCSDEKFLFINFIEAPMEQLELRLIGALKEAEAVPIHCVKQCKTYREAVRVAWTLRRDKSMTVTEMAKEGDFTRQHASDYINPDDKPTRRSLPADAVWKFNAITGNTLVAQWVAAQSRLTVLEEMQATREAA